MIGVWKGMGNREEGQSLVELALTVPILMALLMGVVDLTFILYAHIQVAAAAGEGARAGARHMGDLTETVDANDANRLAVVRQAVSSTMGMLSTASPNFDVGTDVQVSYPSHTGPSNRTGEEMVVTVTYRQPVWFNSLPGVSSGRYQVSSTALMRIQ